MRVLITPSKARGIVTAPPSKSMAHRLLLCAGLSEEESVIKNIALSKDIEATIDCLRALGATVTLDGATARVKGVDVTKKRNRTAELFCNECGSTLRFFIPLCLLSGETRTLKGSETLFRRPLSVYEEICESQDLFFEKRNNSVTVAGKLSPARYEIPGDISSQFISGLLFALPLLSGDSEIRLIPPIESKPYLDMTRKALSLFGVKIEENEEGYRIKGGQSYHARELVVEGDYSNAAFLDALNFFSGDVKVEGLSFDSLQGDRVYRTLFEKLKNGSDEIDISDCPDLGPILFSLAAVCGGGRFSGTKRLRIKESDRAAAMKEELEKFGADVQLYKNTAEVFSTSLHRPTALLNGHNDHRVVMALSVLATRFSGEIDGAEAVEKSFPDFFEKLKSLNVDLSMIR